MKLFYQEEYKEHFQKLALYLEDERDLKKITEIKKPSNIFSENSKSVTNIQVLTMIIELMIGSLHNGKEKETWHPSPSPNTKETSPDRTG